MVHQGIITRIFTEKDSFSLCFQSQKFSLLKSVRSNVAQSSRFLCIRHDFHTLERTFMFFFHCGLTLAECCMDRLAMADRASVSSFSLPQDSKWERPTLSA